jgi:hypothetical protein
MSAIFERASQQWAAMHSEFERYVEASYNKALEATGGVLVNAEGRAKHIDGYDLFTGPAIRAYRYASEELQEYWAAHPRLSMNDFETQWVEGTLEEAA